MNREANGCGIGNYCLSLKAAPKNSIQNLPTVGKRLELASESTLFYHSREIS